MTSNINLFQHAATAQRVAILGVGNELNGDDAAGVLAARDLIEITRSWEAAHRSQAPVFYVAEAGPSPEAFTGPLRRFQPDLVVLIDAAELGEPPGTVATFDWRQAGGMSASTHSLPPTVLAQYLMHEMDCTVVLIGIQPKSLAFDTGVSNEVQRAVDQVTVDFKRLFVIG